MTDRVDISKPAVSIRSELADLKKPSGVAGEAVLKAETLEEQQNLIGVNKTNWVINGDFQIWQRSTTGSASNGFSITSADRWWSVRGALNQETDDHGNPYAHVVCGDYADSAYIQTKVENPGRFSGEWLTFQFEIKSDEGLNDGYIYARNYSTGNAWQNHVLEGFQYGSSWKKFVATWYMPTSITYNTGAYGLELFIYGNYGRFNANTKSYDVRNVQLVEGHYPEGIEFIRRSYGEELALCQRYYIKRLCPAEDNYPGLFSCWLSTSNYINGITQFEVPMRAAPTLAASGNWRGQGHADSGQSASSNMTLHNASPTACRINMSGASFSGTNGQFAVLQGKSTNAYIEFDAELS